MKKIVILLIFCLVQIITQAQTTPAYVPTNGLVGYWPFNGNANDESGNGNNGTVNGATQTSDRNGNANSAYYFNGGGNYITIPYSSSIAVQGSITISCWFLMNGGSCNPRLMQIDQNINSCGGYAIAVNGTSNISRTIHNCVFGSCNSGVLFNPPTVISSLTWHHLAMVVDGISGVGNLYLDGINIQTSNGTPVAPFSYNNNNLTFGNINPGRCDWWGGNLDDIAIYNRALTQQEVTALYTSTPTCTFSSNHFAQDTIAACGSSYTLSAGTGFNNYNWSTGDTTSSITVNNSGWYQCAVTNSAGCTGSDSVYVSLVNATILQNDTTICAGSNLLLAVSTTTTSSLSSSVLPTNLQQGLIGYWPFNGNANDESGNGNNGAVNGATLTSDRNGNLNSAYNFNGNSGIVIPHSSSLVISSAATFSVWIKYNNLTNGALNVVFQKGIAGGCPNSGYYFGFDGLPGPAYKCFGYGVPGNCSGISDNSYLDNQWHNITVIYNPPTSKIYFDGIIQIGNNSANLIQTIINTSDPLLVGQYNGPYSGTSWNGLIDDFGIWNRVLTPQEITQLYNVGNQTSTCFWSTGDTTATINVNPTQTTTYYCTVSNGITSCTDSVTVTVNPLPTNIFAQDTIAACGSSYALSAGAGYSNYNWNTGDTTSSIAVNNSGWYQCTVTNSAGCTASDSIYVAINALPTVTANASSTTICAGTSVTLTGVGATNYTWSGGITDGVSFIPTATTTYMVTGTNANGCTNTATQTITVNTLPTVTATSNATSVCAGTSVTLTGVGATTYTWSGGVTNGVSFIPTATTTYTVTGTNAAGCSKTATKTITVNALPTVTANTTATTVCAGTSVTLTGGGATTYTWTGGVVNGVSFVPTATTTYTVTGTNAAGCTNSATTTITVNALPTVTANASATTVCAGTSVTLTGGGATTYTWTGGVANGVSFVPTATTTYTVTGTNAAGCSNTATQTIAVNALPTVTANASATTVCAGNSVTLTGVGASTYTWSGGVTNGVSFVPTATTTYTVTGTDVNGCTNTATQTITVNALPTVTANGSATSVCTGNSVTLTGGGANTYTWSGGVSNGVSFIPTATTTYTVTGTDVNGCTNTATQTITVNTLPTVTATSSATTVCAGTSVTLNGGGATTYNWTGGVVNGVSFVPTTTTTYTVTGTDINGCTNTATQTITVNALPTVTANASATSVCTGNSVTLTGGGANTYTWSGGVSNGVSFVPTATTTYTVTGTNAAGCSNTATIGIGLQTAPSISVLNTTNASCNPGCDGTVTMNNVPNMVYSISPSVIPSIIGNNISGLCSGTTYTITGTSSVTGCTSTTTVTIGTVSGPLAPIVLSSTPASCNPGCNGIVILYSPVTLVYSIAPSGPIVIGNKILGLCAGTVYTVTGIDAGGCSVQTTISVGTYPNPPAPTSVVTTNATCTPGCDGVVTMSPPIDLTYSVSPGGLVIANVIEGLCDGIIYTVTGTDVKGCTATTTISVGSQTVSPISVLSTTNATCIPGCDGTVTMDNVANMVYTINPAVISPILGNNISGLCSGTTYTITGTSSVTGCTSTTTLTISTNPLPTVTANASATIVCAGTSVTLTGGGASTYTWSGGVTNGVSFVPTVTTTYTVTGTNAAGCTKTATKTITVNALPILIISASKKLYCEKDASGILTGNPVGGVWSGIGVSGNTFNPTVAGLGSFYAVYTFTATNGCTNKDSLLMTVSTCLGIAETTTANLFSVYPNPTTSEINVKTDAQLIGSEYIVYDNSGKIILKGKIKSANTLIKLYDFSAGVYYFTVVNQLYGKQTIKVIKE